MLAHVVKRLAKRRRPNAGIVGFTALVQNPHAFPFPPGHTAAWGCSREAFAALVGFSREYLGGPPARLIG